MPFYGIENGRAYIQVDDWVWVRIGLNPGVGTDKNDGNQGYFTVILDLEIVNGLSLDNYSTVILD